MAAPNFLKYIKGQIPRLGFDSIRLTRIENGSTSDGTSSTYDCQNFSAIQAAVDDLRTSPSEGMIDQVRGQPSNERFDIPSSIQRGVCNLFGYQLSMNHICIIIAVGLIALLIVAILVVMFGRHGHMLKI